MSTPEQPAHGQGRALAERALFSALFDDAAVFPPGLAPIPQAVTDHVARQSSSYTDLVGALLLPASAINDFCHLERSHQMAVGLIGRPGTDQALVSTALSHLENDPAVIVSGVEIGWSPDWRESLNWGASLSVEVPRGSEQERALSELQQHADNPHSVRAKFRTGATPDSSTPTADELAAFMRASIDHDLGFKLTGGLHHALTTTTSEGEEQFGFLNVIAATRSAIAHAAEVPEMSSLLSQRDPMPILDIITRMSDADASVVRASFTAYGCCGVMDPIGDLVALGLIKETTV